MLWSRIKIVRKKMLIIFSTLDIKGLVYVLIHSFSRIKNIHCFYPKKDGTLRYIVFGRDFSYFVKKTKHLPIYRRICFQNAFYWQHICQVWWKRFSTNDWHFNRNKTCSSTCWTIVWGLLNSWSKRINIV